VNRYVGVSGGYLGVPEENRFTYRTFEEFYLEYCGFAKDLAGFQGTTRQRFIDVFLASSTKEQAKIIRGATERFPVGEGPSSRTKALKGELLAEAETLEKQDYVDDPSIAVTSEVVFEALKDATELIKSRKAVSAVDRVHTAFHGYLKSICSVNNIPFPKDADLVALAKKIFESHSKFQVTVKASEIKNIARSLASISDSLNPIRNQGSLAHPNEKLLDEPEATLVINAVRSLMIYLESKLAS
jgi:hypothetical protein